LPVYRCENGPNRNVRKHGKAPRTRILAITKPSYGAAGKTRKPEIGSFHQWPTTSNVNLGGCRDRTVLPLNMMDHTSSAQPHEARLMGHTITALSLSRPGNPAKRKRARHGRQRDRKTATHCQFRTSQSPNRSTGNAHRSVSETSSFAAHAMAIIDPAIAGTST
jgi:hypothetical protein